MIKKLLTLLGVLALAGVSYGQAASNAFRIQGVAANPFTGRYIPRAVVTVCNGAVDGLTSCPSLAPVYTDDTLGTLGSNPGNADLYGNYGTWVAGPGQFGVCISSSISGTFCYTVTASGGGGGGGGTPGGSNTQIQYNNSGAFGGFTMGGDCTLSPSSGVITCTKTNGTSFAPTATDASQATGLIGTPALPNGTTGTTQSNGDNTNKLATDAFVLNNAAAAGVSSFESRTGAVALQFGDVNGLSGASAQAGSGICITGTWPNQTYSACGSPLTTLGDMLYVNSTPALAKLAGNTSATKNFLTQTGTGSVSAAPVWGTLVSADIPPLLQLGVAATTNGALTLCNANVGASGCGSLKYALGTSNGVITFPATTGTVSFLQYAYCGTTATCANSGRNLPIIETGKVALSGGTATITSMDFTLSTSLVCNANDTTATDPVQVTIVSASSVTFTGTGTDVIGYTCIGY